MNKWENPLVGVLEGPMFVQEFDRATTRVPKRPRSHYLGMSGIGDCKRLQWLTYHKPDKVKSMNYIPPRLLRIFELGHLVEESMLEIMREMEGVEIISTQAEYADFDGRLRGHSDVVFRWQNLPSSLIVGDWKTMNSARFSRFQEMPLREFSRKYYAQLLLYAYYEKADWLMLMAYCKDTSEVAVQLVQYNPEEAEQYRQRAQDILDGPMPEECDGDRWCECKNVRA